MAVPALDIAALSTAARGRLGQSLGEWTLRGLVAVQPIDSLYWAVAADERHRVARVLHGAFGNDPDQQETYRVACSVADDVGHPDVPRVVAYATTEDGSPGVVYELGRAEPVTTLTGRPMPAGKALRVVRDVLAILETAHGRGICHGALGPAELFLTDGGRVNVTGFGVVTLSGESPHGFALDPWARWHAPELIRGGLDCLEPASDLWALGKLAADLIVGAGALSSKGHASFATFAPDAPPKLVRLLDRAAAADPSVRFPDASLMRAMVEEVMELHGGYVTVRSQRGAGIVAAAEAEPPASPVRVAIGDPKSPPIQVNAPTIPSLRAVDLSAFAVTERPNGAPDAPPRSEAVPFRSARRDTMPVAQAPLSPRLGQVIAPTGYAMVDADAGEIERLRSLCHTLEMAIVARGQYGPGHPEWFRRLDKLCVEFSEAVENSEQGVFWNVMPYAFSAGGRSVWEPDGLLSSIPYELFADGVRLLGVERGIDREELERFLLVIGRAVEPIPSEDDLVTLLWEANLRHVVYQAVDQFAQGDRALSDAIAGEQKRIRLLSRFDTSAQVEECWARDRARAFEPPPFRPPLVSVLASRETGAESETQSAPPSSDPQTIRSLLLDPTQRTRIGSALRVELEAPPERFAAVVARGFVQAEMGGRGEEVATAFATLVSKMARSRPERALETAELAMAAFGRSGAGDTWRASFGKYLFATDLVEALVSAVDEEGTDDQVKKLIEFLGILSGNIPDLGHRMVSARRPELRRFFTAQLCASVRGREQEIASLLMDADLATALDLVRALVEADTPEARRALASASEHPNPLVRLESLRGGPPELVEKHRSALRELIESDDPAVRRSTLGMVRDHGIRAAGPLVAMRTKSADFDRLPSIEKRDVLLTLAALLPSRAEALCVELVKAPGLVPSAGSDDTRVVAAEVLAKIASSDEVADLLETESKRFLRNSVRVRHAVADAARTVRSSTRPVGEKGRSGS